MTLSYYPAGSMSDVGRTSNMLSEKMARDILKTHSLQGDQKQHTPFESDLLTICEFLLRKLEVETESSTRYWHDLQDTQNLLYSTCNQHSIEKEQLITQIERLLLKQEQLSELHPSDERGA
jgi:hypothetical protein